MTDISVSLDDITLTAKTPVEIVFVDFDFSPLFNTGVTLASATTLASVFTGVDATPQNIVSGPTAISAMVVSQKFINGLAGVEYYLTCTATGSDGTKQEISLLLPVVDRRFG